MHIVNAKSTVKCGRPKHIDTRHWNKQVDFYLKRKDNKIDVIYRFKDKNRNKGILFDNLMLLNRLKDKRNRFQD